MNYVIYCRKSIEAEDRQILSLDSQEQELLAIAQKHNLKVFKVFKESRSAKSLGRPVFAQMMKLIASGKVDAILCWKLDRLARNFVDGGLIMDSLQKGIIKEIRTYEALHLPNETAFILAMQFGMANQYSRDLSMNVKRGNRAKLERGEWPNQAPQGYLNDKANKKVILDSRSAHHIRRTFELYAQGGRHLREVAELMYQEGFRTRTGKKIRAGYIHRILKNPFYYGMMLREGKLYEGIHQPIVTKTLFDQAQDVLEGKLHPRTQKLFFHLRGFLNCANCGCMLTSSHKKGHDYYYCTNGKGICDEKRKGYLRSETLDGYVAGIFENLGFDEKLIELAYKAKKEMGQNKTDYSAKNIEALQKRLDSVRQSQSRLCDSFTAGNTPEGIYNAKMRDLENEEKSLIKQMKDIKPTGESTLEPIRELFLEANRAKKEYEDGFPEEKRILANRLLWNLAIKNREPASYLLKGVYDKLARSAKPTDLSGMLTTSVVDL